MAFLDKCNRGAYPDLELPTNYLISSSSPGRKRPGLLRRTNRGNRLPEQFSETFLCQLWYYEVLETTMRLVCTRFQKRASFACHRC